MTETTMTDAERVQFLRSLGLPATPAVTPVVAPVAPVELVLDEVLAPDAPAKPKKDKAAKVARREAAAAKKAAKVAPVVLAQVVSPVAANERLLAPHDIVFDEDMIAGFDLTDSVQRKAARSVLFERFKSPHRDTLRHRVLLDLITEYVSRVHRTRSPRGYVHGRAVASSVSDEAARELAALLAERGITAAQLAAILGGA